MSVIIAMHRRVSEGQQLTALKTRRVLASVIMAMGRC
jgi:hypothetical protein